MANINGQQINHYSLLGQQSKTFSLLDLSVTGEIFQQKIDDWDRYLSLLPINEPSSIYHGGYLENRFFYSNENLFGAGNSKRDIHLGVDLWVEAKTNIYCPMDAIVHSMKYNDLELDYGYTIVLKHQIDQLSFYTLYGHLSDQHLMMLKANDFVPAGTKFCQVGAKNQNGNWPPHLHFQVIVDIGNHVGDYPGVCSREDLEYYKNNCPDGTSFIF